MNSNTAFKTTRLTSNLSTSSIEKGDEDFDGGTFIAKKIFDDDAEYPGTFVAKNTEDDGGDFGRILDL